MTEDLMKYIPKMLIGKELDDKLLVLPSYDENIRKKAAAERLIALQSTVYKGLHRVGI